LAIEKYLRHRIAETQARAANEASKLSGLPACQKSVEQILEEATRIQHALDVIAEYREAKVEFYEVSITVP